MPNETVAVPTTPEGVLCRAAEVIEQVGWVQGDYGVAEGVEGVCLIGACLSAIGVDPVQFEEGDEWPEPVERAAELILGHIEGQAQGTGPVCQVVWWNDSECESKEQAVSVLRAAAGGCKEAPGAA